MDNNMPSMADLSTIFGSYSPEMYMQGQRQIGYSNQMQEQNIEKSSLANQFSAQQNPQLLENQRLQNEGVGFDNQSKGAKARFDVATEGFKLDDEKRKQALAAPEHEIKMMAAQAQQMAYSPDPAVQAKGKKLMQMSQAAIEARQKHTEEIEKQELIRKSAERVAAGNNAATRYTADKNLEGRKIGVTGKSDPMTIVSKLGYEKAAQYFHTQAMFTEDAEMALKYKELAATYEQANLAQKNAAAQGKVDPSFTGLPTQTVPTHMGTQTPKPQAPSAPAVGTVSKGHVFLGGDPSNPQSWKKQ